MNLAPESETPVDCVTFMLLKDGSVLSERRKVTKTVAPGAVALPGGHIEPGECPESALDRELLEELGVTAVTPLYVCTLLHRAEEFRKVYYFAILEWEGRISNMEADNLSWLPLTELDRLNLDVDRVAVNEYLRVYRPTEVSPLLSPDVHLA